MAMLAALCLAALCSSATSAGVSPVQKVIQLIDDMAVKVKGDLDATTREFEEYAKYCDDEATAKDYAIKSTKEQIEALSATVEDATAKISELEAKIEGLTTKISSAEGELSEAESNRKEAHADFIATEKEMLESVETLTTATETLKKSLGFMQLSPDSSERQGLDQVLASLGHIVDANFVSNEQRSKVQAFLQAQEDAEDSLTLSGPAGGADAVIGTLEEMTSKAEGTLEDTRKEEMDAAHEYALMSQSMQTEIETMKEDLADATKSKQFNAEAKAAASKDLAVEKEGLTEDNSVLGELKRSCQERASEYEAEKKDGEAELTALGKAKDILAKKFSSFVQTRTAVKVRSDDEDVRAKALRHVQEVGKKFHSMALVALAYRASADPFVKVRGMIEDMIAKLLQEAAEEADQKAFCDKEIGESKASQAQKEESLAKTEARLDKASSSVAKLTELVTTLTKEVADIDAAVSDATAIRNSEKAEFMKVEKDLSESEEACAAAISVLREYYEGAALVQVKAEVSAKATGDGSGILGVLEIAESDFAKLLAEARGTEEASATEYKKMMQENKLAKVTKEMDIKGKKSELKGLETSIAEYNEDKEGTSSELSAVLEYLDKLKPQCETKVPSYAEIKAKRDAEIQGLKEALDILSGDGVPAFVQTGLYLRARRAA